MGNLIYVMRTTPKEVSINFVQKYLCVPKAYSI